VLFQIIVFESGPPSMFMSTKKHWVLV